MYVPRYESNKHIVQSVIFRESLELQVCNLSQIYSYLIAIKLPTHNIQLAEFTAILDSLVDQLTFGSSVVVIS